jgi:transcriptional regulator with XRE-family HTH domain
MDIETNSPGETLFRSSTSSDALKAKTSDRLHYEAQVQVIRRQLGGLEEIRGKLGLSQRKICQLLMVDPSAWTRWTKSGVDQAPPHIYRALQWYMSLQEKIPGLTPAYFLGRDPRVLNQQLEDKISLEVGILKAQISALQIQDQKLQRSLLFYKVFALISTLVLLSIFLVNKSL